MNLIIDGQPREVTIAADAKFPEVMRAVGQIQEAPGIGITRVKLNGRDITGADWSHYAGVGATTMDELEVETGNVSALAGELLDSLEDFTGRLISELGRTAESFRLGDDQRAAELYSRTLEGIQLLSHTTVMVARNLKLNTAQLQFGGRPTNEHLQKLPPLIDDMFAAQQKEDWVLLADLIEYELIPQFEDHQRIFRLWREAHNAAR